MSAVLALVVLLVLASLRHAASAGADQFTYEGFASASLALDGAARIAPNGLLVLTNGTVAMTGHALHPSPLRFRDSNATAVRSFSASFVHGMAFFVSRARSLSTTMPYQYLGLLNTTDGAGAATNHILAVEFDTVINYEFADINNNHVGIDVDSLRSVAAASAGYYDDDAGGVLRDLSLYSRDAMQVWVDYDGRSKALDVTLAPLGVPKPRKPLLSRAVDLAAVVPDDEAYVGFSSSTGVMACSHYVLGWSFALDGAAPPLDVSRLPDYPRPADSKPGRRKVLVIALPIAAAAAAAVVTAAAVLVYVRRRMEYVELREDWEAEFGAHRFAYKDLHRATDGFADRRLIGRGGSGEVYKGVLPRCKSEVAVKRVSDESMQRVKEFVAEVASMGRLRHRTLVPLLGYCRRKGELLLVYTYMPNGSLESFLYGQGKKMTLRWDQRFRIIKDVATGLLYLHEEWEQVIVHRDIKPSNVLLDDEMHGRLGDFGLARLYDHGANSYTTRVVGTTGYLAPELMSTGKASPATDVFAFGAFLLEVACGRGPVEQGVAGESFALVDHVLRHWLDGSLMEAVDSKLQGSYDEEEVCLALKLGLICSHQLPSERPSMRQVVQYLDGGAAFPELVLPNLSRTL
ncbi:hypothetical protein BS78_01G065900 [Paspalum vaginatum]|nr:hypothetical protein BS78_01G065900 [Paspalum vaginatum]